MNCVKKKNYLKNRSRYTINPGIDFYKMARFSSNYNPIKTYLKKKNTLKDPLRFLLYKNTVISGITLNGQSLTIF